MEQERFAVVDEHGEVVEHLVLPVAYVRRITELAAARGVSFEAELETMLAHSLARLSDGTFQLNKG